jgi:hypothetical protein
LTESSPSTQPFNEVEERAGDAKFFLTLGSGAFILLGLLLLIPHILNYLGVILFPPNIALTSLITGLGYLIPGIVLFIWGLGKVFQGEDLTFQQVWQAHIQRGDIKRTFRFLVFVTFFVILLVVPVLIGLSVLDIMNAIIAWALSILGPIGGYIGVFIISIFGNFTVIFPVPYLFVLLLIALIPGFTLLDALLVLPLVKPLPGSSGVLKVNLSKNRPPDSGFLKSEVKLNEGMVDYSSSFMQLHPYLMIFSS